MATNPPELLQAPRRHSQLRLGFFRAARGCARALGGRRWYRWRYLHPERMVLRREILRVPNWPAELEGLRLLQLSDFHAGPFLRGEDLWPLVRGLESDPPDLIALTGDFITDRWEDVQGLAPVLGALPARLGAYAVLGNHDYRGRQVSRLVETLAQHGIRTLLDESVHLDGVPLWVTGLHDLEERRGWARRSESAGEAHGAEVELQEQLRRMRAQHAPGDWELALCHHPIGAAALARERTFAILSGHTHGRQIDRRWLRTLGPAHPGLQVPIFAAGVRTSQLYVHRGVGVVGVPLRSRAPAEALWLEVHRGPRWESTTQWGTVREWSASRS